MTDVTTETPNIVEAPEATPAPVAKVSYWQRPHVRRFIVPLIIPILAVLAIVVYVLNISRVFLSAHAHIPVVICSVVLVAILFGATLLANASLKTASITLFTAGFVFVIFVSGWLVLGSSQEKKTNSSILTAAGPYDGTFTIVASPTGALTFGPSSLSVKTGVYLVTLRDGASITHTLDFDQSSTLWAGLIVNSQGDKQSSRIFFGTAGDYTFYCAIPGHRTAGMQGVVHVSGPTVTLAQAEAAGKGGSAGGSGGSGAA
jgi:plastocyanin